MHIEILGGPESITTRSYTRDGQQMTNTSQQAYLFFPGQQFPLPFKMAINSAPEAYPAGKYVLHPDSVRTNQYGQLEFARFDMKLLPLKAA